MRGTGNFLGAARRETGSVRSRSSNGAMRMIDDSEEWTRNVSESNAADERPDAIARKDKTNQRILAREKYICESLTFARKHDGKQSEGLFY